MEGNLRFKIDWASLVVGRKFPVFAVFYFVLEGNFQVQAPGGLYLEGLFKGGFFALPVWGAYIWRVFTVSSLIYLNNKLAPFSLGWNSDEERK